MVFHGSLEERLFHDALGSNVDQLSIFAVNMDRIAPMAHDHLLRLVIEDDREVLARTGVIVRSERFARRENAEI